MLRTIQFNDQYQVLVDGQGLMIPTSDLIALANLMKTHLSHSPLELEAIGRRTLEENHPEMVEQFNEDYFK